MAKAVEIVPGRSIGSVRLGTTREALPPNAVLTGDTGSVDGVRFSLGSDGLVSDVWIEDIRAFPNALALDGRAVPVSAALDDVKIFFGACVEVEGIKGRKFYNCSSGVALGCRYDGSGGFIQLRIRPR